MEPYQTEGADESKIKVLEKNCRHFYQAVLRLTSHWGFLMECRNVFTRQVEVMKNACVSEWGRMSLFCVFGGSGFCPLGRKST